MNFWYPGISKVYQTAIGLCLIFLLYFVANEVRLYLRVDFEVMGLDRGNFSIAAETDLAAAGFKAPKIWPTSDWRGMDVTIKLWKYTGEKYQHLNIDGPILPLIQAFALEGFRYSQTLCRKAETEYPLALIESINVHYYLVTIDLDDPAKETAIQEQLVFSEASDCDRIPGISIWEYLWLPWSQKTRYFIWSFH